VALISLYTMQQMITCVHMTKRHLAEDNDPFTYESQYSANGTDEANGYRIIFSLLFFVTVRFYLRLLYLVLLSHVF
jgi:hypothetical protein